MNFLESLAAEWYEYTGHFVRTNVCTDSEPSAAGTEYWTCPPFPIAEYPSRPVRLRYLFGPRSAEAQGESSQSIILYRTSSKP